MFLNIGGVHGDKNAGIEQLTLAATSGHYLRPYAKLLLALASLREKDTNRAREQFAQLTAEFPENPLFAQEFAKINSASAHSNGSGGSR